MKKILDALIILTIIDPGFTGDKRVEKRCRNDYTRRNFLSLLNKTEVDTYYATDPLTKGHEGRIKEKLSHENPRYLRQRVLYWIEKMCEEWKHITGLSDAETYKILDKIHSESKIDGPDRESKLRDKLLEVRPEFRKIDSEIIRSVVHDWFRILRKESRFLSREEEADLLFTYYQVLSGDGQLRDRLAEKWKQFRPHLSNFSKFTLHYKANTLATADPGFSSKEMGAARERYESVFNAGSGTDIEAAVSKRRKKWSKEQMVDLLYLTSLHKKRKLFPEEFKFCWRMMHPELASIKDKNLVNKRSLFNRRRFKEELTPEEDAAAESRLKAALAQIGISHQKYVCDEQGGSPAAQSSHGGEFHQQEPNWMIHSSPLHDDNNLTDEDWRHLRMLMNNESSSHPSTPLYSPLSYYYGNSSFTPPNQVPFGMPQTQSGLSTHDPYNVNPYYEHGSSSQSHYDPYTMNSYYEHGSSSHSRESGT